MPAVLVIEEYIRHSMHFIDSLSLDCGKEPHKVWQSLDSLTDPCRVAIGGDIVYPAATSSEATSSSGQALESLQAVLTQPLPAQQSSTPHKGGTPGKRRGAGLGMLVVICDEMDQLMSTAQDVLYDLFFLPQVQTFTIRSAYMPHCVIRNQS